MAATIVDPDRIHPFKDSAAFEHWLSQHHHSEPEVWIRIFKKGSGIPTISAIEAIDVVLCWGWIDAIRKGYDDVSFIQRYVPRGKKSVWSKINVDNVARLTAAGRMTEHGQKHVDLAKADGRWDKAYAMDMAPPEDLLAAIEDNGKAAEFYRTLSAQNRFALTFRTHNLKTAAGRANRIRQFVEMLERGETIYPQKAGKP